MLLYLSIVFVATILIIVLNIFCNPVAVDYTWYWIALATIISVIVEIAIDGLSATLIHSMPDKWFNPDKKFFCVGRRERKFYDKIKIKSWKDKVWELGALGGFRKNKLADPSDPEYLYRFIIENNKGLIVHLVALPVNFAVILILPLKFALTIGLPVVLVGTLLNVLPFMILRYNIPKLKAGYERARRLKERQVSPQAVNNSDNANACVSPKEENEE